VARFSPRRLKEAAARLLEYPSAQMTIRRVSCSIGTSMRQGDVGSHLHSSTVRSIATAPGIVPPLRRCAWLRMSISSAPPACSAAASAGVSRSRLRRAVASTLSMAGLRGVVAGVRLGAPEKAAVSFRA